MYGWYQIGLRTGGLLVGRPSYWYIPPSLVSPEAPSEWVSPPLPTPMSRMYMQGEQETILNYWQNI